MSFQGRQQHLDGLRGLAALVVCVTHLSLVAFPALFNGLPSMARLRWEWTLAGTPLGILWAADFAVCIFFVMSSMVLCAFFDQEGRSFPANCVRRYLRLTLPIFGASAIAYLLWRTVGMHNLEAQQITQEGWLKLFYLSRPHAGEVIKEPFYRIYAAPTSILDPPLWTMRFELLGSIGVFAYCALVRNRRLRFMLLAVGAVLAFQSYYLCFVGGAFIYEWSKLPTAAGANMPKQAWWALFLAGAYMGAFPFNVAGPDNIWFGWMAFLKPEDWHAIGATPFVLAITQLSSVRRLLTTRIPQYLGKISFSLYLIHVPLIGSLMTWLIVQLYEPPHRLRVIAMAIALTLPVIFLCAHFFEKLIDSPSIRLSQRVGKALEAWFPSQVSQRRSDGTSTILRPAPSLDPELSPSSLR